MMTTCAGRSVSISFPRRTRVCVIFGARSISGTPSYTKGRNMFLVDIRRQDRRSGRVMSKTFAERDFSGKTSL